MGALGFLIYPWGFVAQGIALYHYVKRRPENHWLYTIILGGALGAGIYVIVEMIPDLGLLRNAFQGFGRRSRIEALETQILDNPSAGNLEELAELYFDQKEYARASDALDRAIAARSDSPHAFYLRAKAKLALGRYGEAIPDLELVVGKDAKFDYHRAVGLVTDACAHRATRTAGVLLYAGCAVFDHAGDTLQPRELFEIERREGRGETVGEEISGEEADFVPLYAAGRATVVP